MSKTEADESLIPLEAWSIMKKNILSLIVSVLALGFILIGSRFLGIIGAYLLYYIEDTWLYQRFLSNLLPFALPILSGGLPAWIAGLSLVKIKDKLNWKVVVSLPLIVAIPAAGLHVFGFLYDEMPLSFGETMGLAIGSLLMPWMLVVFLRPDTEKK
jgi:hypothetical protein